MRRASVDLTDDGIAPRPLDPALLADAFASGAARPRAAAPLSPQA
jgi:hypothetical protein